LSGGNFREKGVIEENGGGKLAKNTRSSQRGQKVQEKDSLLLKEVKRGSRKEGKSGNKKDPGRKKVRKF